MVYNQKCFLNKILINFYYFLKLNSVFPNLNFCIKRFDNNLRYYDIAHIKLKPIFNAMAKKNEYFSSIELTIQI